MLKRIRRTIDLEQLLLDSTIIGVHQHEAGEKKKGLRPAVDALGNPLRSILTAGQDSDPGSSLDGGFGS